MALVIRGPEVERLAVEVAALTGESTVQAVKVALQERKQRLTMRTGRRGCGNLLRFLEREVWPQVPRSVLGRRVTKRELTRILG